MTLNNMVQDPSMIHEVLSYEVFRAAGVPASRTGYAYVRLKPLLPNNFYLYITPPREEHDLEAIEAGVDKAREFIAARPGELSAWLDPVPPADPSPAGLAASAL